MGVPRLFSWLKRSFPRAIQYYQQGEKKQKVDYLYLDANGMLHGAAQKVFNYGQSKTRGDRYGSLSFQQKIDAVYRLFFENIIQVLEGCNPQELLYIAIDGPAPLAKQAQQRHRRFIAAMSFDPTAKFSSNIITPGTQFMNDLSAYMYFTIRKELNRSILLRGVKIVFSPPTVPGEGEHKALDYIRGLSTFEQQNKSHCLFGPDGDLIMLCLSAHIPKVFLYREDQFNIGYEHYIDMGYVRKNLPRVLGYSIPKELDQISDDFIILGFFVGNDFLPKIQMFHLLEDGLELMIKTYMSNNSGLSRQGKFHMKGFKSFIKGLVKHEVPYLYDQATTRNPRKQPPVDDNGDVKEEYINHTLISSITNNRLDFEEYREKYYKKIGYNVKTEKGKEYIEQLCSDYLRTFVWVFYYYTSGLKDWKWAFEHHYPPLMKDFAEFLEEVPNKKFKKLETFEMHQPSLPFEQLLSVLPASSSSFLPQEYRWLMESPESPLVKAGYYPQEFHIDYEGKIKEHEGVAILPFVDFDYIHCGYNTVKQKRTYIQNGRDDVSEFVYTPTTLSRFKNKYGELKHIRVKKL